MSAKVAQPPKPSLAKPLAPEDVCVGDYVAVLSEEYEWPAACWYVDPPIGAEPVVRLRVRPRPPSGPLKVMAVCLPFVLAKPPKGKPQTLDVRAVRLARIHRGYAKVAWRALKD